MGQNVGIHVSAGSPADREESKATISFNASFRAICQEQGEEFQLTARPPTGDGTAAAQCCQQDATRRSRGAASRLRW
jgi:hypothetical protein